MRLVKRIGDRIVAALLLILLFPVLAAIAVWIVIDGGRPAILAAPDFDHGKTSHGIPEFNAGCEAVAMGRTTFDPAVTNPWWPWPDLDVHVLTSRPLPEGDFPSEIVAPLRSG